MAIEVVEQQDSKGYSQTGGQVTASRRFSVWDDTTPITTPTTIRDYFGSSGLPAIGDSFGAGASDLYAVSFTIDPQVLTRGAWSVVFGYSTTEGSTAQPQEVGYTEFSMDYAAEPRAMYRTNPNIPTDGSPSATTNIAGTEIDAAGIPVSQLMRFTSVVIRETVFASSVVDRSYTIRATRGKRNSLPFYGAPRGQVLYLGARASRISVDKFSIEHRFAQDDQFHMIQNPDRDSEGVPLCSRVNGILRASVVRFVQLFPQFANFNKLSENF